MLWSGMKFRGSLGAPPRADVRGRWAKDERLHPPRRRGLDVEEGLVQVGDDVLYVFDAYGEADEAFGDAYALADFDGHGGVSHQRGKGNESFDAAEAFG